MNKEDPYRDQAERLRQRIEKINDSNEIQDTLPPRVDLHRNVRKKTKWKLKFPIIRLLLIMFILLMITIYSVYSYLGGKKIGDFKKASSPVPGFETVNIVNNSQPKNVAPDDAGVGKRELQKDAGTTQAIIAQSATGSNLIKPSTSETKGPETDKNGSVDAQQISKKNVTSTPMEARKYKFHTVGHKETLYHIAMSYYHSPDGVEWIKAANSIKEDGIKEGQVLKIPMKK